MRRLSTGVAAAAMTAALAMSGCGTDAQPDPTPSAPSSTAPNQHAVISADQARTIAVEAAGGGQVTEVESDDENNVPVWKVTVIDPDGDRHRVSVDKATGQVLVNEIDDRG